MPRAKLIQTSFASGVLDPLLAGRIDLEHYYQGMKVGNNVLPRLQGGFSRRPGTAYRATVPTDGRLEAFAFNTEQLYCIYFGDEEIRIFLDGALQATVSSPWPVAIAHELGTAQAADTMIICHEDYEPRKLVRGASHTSWSLTTYALTNIPLGDYNDADSPAETAEIHTLTFSTSPAWAQGDYFRLQLGGRYESGRIYWAADADVLSERVRKAIVDMLTGKRTLYGDESTTITGYGIGGVRQVTRKVTVDVARIQGLTGDGVTVTEVYPVLTVTLDDGDADDYTEISVLEVNASASATLVAALTQAGTRRREVVFSAGRGWPKYPMFYEGRLWLGGCKSLPQAVFATVTNDYANMGLGDSLDDDGIFMLLDTDQVNAVTGLVPGRNLMILTTGGEHVILDKPVTPATAFAPQQTDYGSLAIKPALLEGAAVYAQRRGKQLMEMVYYWQEDAYTSKSVSLLSQHLINIPRQMAAQKGTTLDTAVYLFVVNQDGTMAVMLSSRAQEIAAWANWTTDGLYKSVTVVEDQVYALVQRTINGNTVYYLEQFATNVYTDSASIQTLSPASTSVTGLSHLEGEDVKVRADGSVLLPDETVVSGAIEMQQEATTVEVGLNYIPLVETMPPAPNFGEATLGATRRITWVKAVVDRTRGLRINGDVIPDRQTDVDPLDTPPPERTGIIEHRPRGSNWSLAPTITFTQEDPHPMTVLAAVMEVEVNER